MKRWLVSIRWGGLRWTQRVNELIEKRGRFSYSFDSLGFLRRFIFQSASYVCVLYFRSIAFSQSSILIDFGCLNGRPNRRLHNVSLLSFFYVLPQANTSPHTILSIRVTRSPSPFCFSPYSF